MQLRAEIRWPVNLKQMFDQQINYLLSNLDPYGPLFMLFCSQKNKAT